MKMKNKQRKVIEKSKRNEKNDRKVAKRKKE